MKTIELEPEKISGLFLHIGGKWHSVTEIDVDYNIEKRCGRLEIKYEEVKKKGDYRIAANVPVGLIDDLKAFGLSNIKESVFLIEFGANEKISWSLSTRREIEKNPDFARIHERG